METKPATGSVITESLRSLAVPIDNLQTDPDNARRGDIAAIRSSLNVFGQRKPVVVKRTGVDAAGVPTGIVIAGNHTYLAARELDWTHVAAVFVDDDANTARAYALADNRTGELATWDDEQLAKTLRELSAEDFDTTSLGWTVDDLAALLNGDNDDDDADDPDDPDGDEAPQRDTRVEPLVYSDEQVIDSAFTHFRATGYPFPVVPRYVAMQAINVLAATPTTRLLTSQIGQRVPDPYQKHRYSTPVQGARTVLDVFDNDEYLLHGLKFLAEDGNGTISDSRIRSVFNFVRNAQLAAQFRPAFALLMFRRFAQPGATVLDTSTGFGGRLVGFFASDCAAYIGIDPNTVTTDGNRRMSADLCPAGKTVELHCLPAEDVPHELLAGRAHFAFTSPPYFAKELYSDEPTQSCVRYATGDAWRSGFLEPMLRLQAAALVPGAHSCINIADVRIGKETYPLVEWTIEAARAAGFEHVTTEQLPLARVPGQGERPEAYESVIVFRRPEGDAP